MIVGLIVLIAVNLIILSVVNRRSASYAPGRVAFSIVSPFQRATARSIRLFREVWAHYFFLVSAAKERDNLKKEVSRGIEKNNQFIETELSNLRLRSLLSFEKTVDSSLLAAEVIGKDPSPWFKTMIINKGMADGVEKGFPVVVSEGLVGQIVDVSTNYAKVLLLVDHNSAVDSMVQRSRARGIVKGESATRFIFKYVLNKEDVKTGDNVISSGLDGVFPKGLRIGAVTAIQQRRSGIFQEVVVKPYVDFEKLEEVLVLLK